MISLPERASIQTEAYRKLLDNFGFKTRVASPGIIQSFDATKQTVTVQLALNEKIVVDGVQTWETIPLLVDVPILMPRAGGFTLTMPVTIGDECLVVFSDCCFDAWWQSGGIQNQIDRRRHDLSDGFAILGVWSQPRVISGYSTDSAQLRSDDGTSVVEVKANEINITAPTINIAGASLVNIEADENTRIEGRVFMDHQHKDVLKGNELSGGVN